MPLTLVSSALKSRTVRQAIVGTAAGNMRELSLNATYDQSDDSGNVITSIYNGIERFGQSLIQLTLRGLKGLFNFSITGIVNWCVRTYFFLMNFNWNSTDAQLDEQIKQGEIALAAQRGGLRGKALGFAICGLIPTATIAVFNEPMALYILKELGEEAAEEIASSLSSLISLQITQWTRMTFINLFKNYRSILRPAATGFAQILVSAGILSQDSVDKANKKKNEPWTFAGAIDETVESIKDPIAKADAENFWEDFQDACIEAGYIVAGQADAYIAQQKMHSMNIKTALKGKEKVIEIDLDRTDNSDEP